MVLRDELGVLLTREQQPRPPVRGAQPGRIVSVGPDRLIRFTLPELYGDMAWEGARWSAPADMTGLPPAGSDCLVVFAGGDMSRPWVVGWGPPTGPAPAATDPAPGDGGTPPPADGSPDGTASASAPGTATVGADGAVPAATTGSATAAGAGSGAADTAATTRSANAGAPTGYVFWFDISHYQADASPPIDLGRMFNLGFAACMAKIGQGAGTTDSGTAYGATIDTGWAGFRDRGRALWGNAFAGYWYVGGTESPADQASRCKAALGDLTIPVVLDWEAGGGDFTNLRAVLAAFRSAGIRVTCLYCGSGYASGHGAANIDSATGLAVIRARYYVNSSDTPRALWDQQPAGFGYEQFNGATPKAHQFTQYGVVAGASTSGGSMTIDVSDFPGTAAGLAALLSGS